jgi:hypothetical protein
MHEIYMHHPLLRRPFFLHLQEDRRCGGCLGGLGCGGDGGKGGRGGDVHGASLGFGRERRVDLEGGGSKGDDSM